MVTWSTSTPRSANSSSTSRKDRPKRRYQRTASTITSGGKQKPAKADRGTVAGRGRQGLMTTVCLLKARSQQMQQCRSECSSEFSSLPRAADRVHLAQPPHGRCSIPRHPLLADGRGPTPGGRGRAGGRRRVRARRGRHHRRSGLVGGHRGRRRGRGAPVDDPVLHPLAAGRHRHQRRDPLRRVPSPAAGLAAWPATKEATMTRYRTDIEAARRRLAAREHHSIQTPYGSVQYAEHGQGPPLLFSHPLVGGFDVGLGCADTWVGDGFLVIAPSRFGYLGSSLPPSATPADQADAYALLLDKLGIERAAVVGFSAGGPSVIQFALRHPERTAGLVLIGSAL